MNRSISILFRAIPLVMALLCFSYGAYIYFASSAPGNVTAGVVIFFLGTICLALFATAATIIRQITGTYNNTVRYALPVMGYSVALITLAFGIYMCTGPRIPHYFVPGHVVCGLALIALCVSTAATASTRFTLIPENSARPLPEQGRPQPNPAGFTLAEERLLEAVAVCAALAAWIWAFVLLKDYEITPHLVAGSVMGGIACVCTSLIGLVSSIARQIRNDYTRRERHFWPSLALTMGCIALVWGLLLIFFLWGKPADFVGFVLIGLGMICLSISSKIILLAKIWHADYPLANRIPLIPVLTALFCLFLAAFLFEEAVTKTKFFVPARVLTGFGAICFTLFSIVSILESGTRKK